MINLNELHAKLIAENDRKFDNEQNWHEGYNHGVWDALSRVDAAMREEPAETAADKPAEADVPHKPRTNFDCIRAMSAEELAEWLDRHILDCDGCPLSDRLGGCTKAANGSSCKAELCVWLNSPAKEDNNA